MYVQDSSLVLTSKHNTAPRMFEGAAAHEYRCSDMIGIRESF